MLYLQKSPQNYYILVLSNEMFFDIYLLDNSPGASPLKGKDKGMPDFCCFVVHTA